MEKDATEILWNHIQEHVDGSTYRQFLQRTEAGEHPGEETLSAYSRDSLDIEQERAINRHLALCRRCTRTVMRAMRRIDLTDALRYDYYWEPTGHEKRQTAAAGKHVFTLDEHQHITIECEYTQRRIWIGWHIETDPDCEYVLLFIDPDTTQELYRKSLKTIRDGEVVISRSQLAFDPTTTRWAIAIGKA